MRRANRLPSASPLTTCKCGGTGVVELHSDLRNSTDVALGQMVRKRVCKACNARWDTIELRASEVQELRLSAHLWRMYGVRAQPAPPAPAPEPREPRDERSTALWVGGHY